MDPKLSWLATFVAVAEDLHFGRAAERLRLSPSAVSRHIRLLEDALHTTLFRRTSRSVILTPEGRRVYGAIAVPVATIEEALRRRPGDRSDSRTISVAYVSTPGERMIPRAAALFGADQRGYELRLLPASSSEQRTGLIEGWVDIGVQWTLPGASVPAGLEHAPIRDEPLTVALPPGHPYAASTELRLIDLAGEDWLMAVDSSDLPLRQGFIAACQRAGFLPRIRSEATGIKAQLSLVAAGQGVCLVPTAMRDSLDFGIGYTQVRDLNASLVAVTRPAPNRAMLRFIELLRLGD